VKKSKTLLLGSLLLMASLLIWINLSPDKTASTTTAEPAPEPGTRISGRLTDIDGEPIVEASARTDGSESITDEDGQFALDNLAAGPHVLYFSKEGYVIPLPERESGFEVDLKDEDLDGLDFVLRRAASVEGRVIAGGKAVVAHLSLYYLNAEGWTGPLEPFAVDVGATDNEGRFSVGDVFPGRLRILVDAEGYASGQSQELQLDDDQRRQGLLIDLEPSGQLVGTIIDQEENPIPGAEVLLQGHTSSVTKRLKTNSQGIFRARHLPADTVQVTVRARGFRTEERDVSVRIREVTATRIKLVSSEGIFGRVIGPDGRGVPGAHIVCRRSDAAAGLSSGETKTFFGNHGRRSRSSGERTLRSDRQGHFSMEGAEVGDWILQATSRSHAPSQEQRAETGSEVTLALGQGGTLFGEVIGSDGSPIPTFTLGVESARIEGPLPYGARGFRPRQFKGTSGRFEWEYLAPGVYEIRAIAPGYPGVSSAEIRVEAATRHGPILLKMQAGASIHGVVRAASGEPLSGAAVSVFDPMSPFSPKRARTDAAGVYEISGIAPGRRSLRVTKNGYLAQIAAGIEIGDGDRIQRDISLEPAKAGARFAFHGIGAMLTQEKDGIRIRNTIEGMPAQLYGLQSNDLITAVDGQSTNDMRLDRVVELIRGEEGVEVEIEIERPESGSFAVTIERGRVTVKQDPKTRPMPQGKTRPELSF
jgi:hypothetical protein